MTCDAATISKVFHPPPGIAQEFRKTVQDVASSFVLATFSHHDSDIFRNFIAHAQKIQDESGTFPPIVVVTTDTASQTACDSVGWHNLKCFNGAGWLPLDYNSVPVAFGTCSYTLLTFLKPAALKIALTALHPDSAVLYTDIDVMWYKNALSLVSSMAGEADFLCRDERIVPYVSLFLPTQCNGGFIFAKRSSAPLIDKWIENSLSDKFDQTKGTHGDQDPLNVVLWSGEFQSHVKQIDKSLIGHCGTSGTMARHYTCANGDKIGEMQRAGDWLVKRAGDRPLTHAVDTGSDSGLPPTDPRQNPSSAVAGGNAMEAELAKLHTMQERNANREQKHVSSWMSCDWSSYNRSDSQEFEDRNHMQGWFGLYPDFEMFMNHVRKTSTNQTATLQQSDKIKMMYSLARSAAATLDKLNLNWFVIDGSLIGYTRNLRLIPWDDDFDIGVSMADRPKLFDFIQEKADPATYVKSSAGLSVSRTDPNNADLLIWGNMDQDGTVQKVMWFDRRTEVMIDFCFDCAQDPAGFVPTRRVEYGPLRGLNVPADVFDVDVNKALKDNEGISFSRRAISLNWWHSKEQVHGPNACKVYQCEEDNTERPPDFLKQLSSKYDDNLFAPDTFKLRSESEVASDLFGVDMNIRQEGQCALPRDFTGCKDTTKEWADASVQVWLTPCDGLNTLEAQMDKIVRNKKDIMGRYEARYEEKVHRGASEDLLLNFVTAPTDSIYSQMMCFFLLFLLGTLHMYASRVTWFTPKMMAIYFGYIALHVALTCTTAEASRKGIPVQTVTVISVACVAKFVVSAILFAMEPIDCDEEVTSLDRVALTLRARVEETYDCRWTLLACAMPAWFYVLSDIGDYVAVQHISITVAKVVYSLKMPLTAVLWVRLFSKSLRKTTWIGLAVITISGLLQVASKAPTLGSEGMIALRYLPLVLFAAVMSVAASLWNEYLLRGRPGSINLQNMAIYAFSFVGIISGRAVTGQELWGWHLLTPIEWLVASMLTGVGLVTAYMFKHLGVAWREIAQGSILLGCMSVESLVFRVPFTHALTLCAAVSFVGLSLCSLEAIDSNSKAKLENHAPAEAKLPKSGV
jgi:hypothetical protein